MVCGPLPKTPNTCGPCSSIGFCNITAELFSKGLCSWPPGKCYVAAKGAEGLSRRKGTIGRTDTARQTYFPEMLFGAINTYFQTIFIVVSIKTTSLKWPEFTKTFQRCQSTLANHVLWWSFVPALVAFLPIFSVRFGWPSSVVLANSFDVIFRNKTAQRLVSIIPIYFCSVYPMPFLTVPS